MTDFPIKYRLIKKEKHTGARLGEIITPHGTFPTPMFMPVGTQATVKTLSPEELYAMGSQVILTNTYHLFCIPVRIEDMEALFACKEGFYLRVNTVRYVAILFDALLENTFIQSHWQDGSCLP